MNIQSKDFAFNKHWGMLLLAHHARFELNRQMVFVQNPAGAIEESSSSSSGGSFQEQDLGTQMTGKYNFIVPTIYYDMGEHFRFGLGYGRGLVKLHGNFDGGEWAPQGILGIGIVL